MNVLRSIREHEPLSRNARFALLALVPIYFIVAGLVIQPVF